MTNTLADGSYWVYGYDALGQVISRRRYWSDGRDTLGEAAAANLFALLRNAVLCLYDRLGAEERKFDYEGQDIYVSPTMTANGNPCKGGSLQLKVHIDANNADPGGTYMNGAHFAFDGTQVNYKNYNGGPPRTTFDLITTLKIPWVCPVRSVGGADTFTAWRDADGGTVALTITFDWSFECDPCCALRKPRSVSFGWDAEPPLYQVKK